MEQTIPNTDGFKEAKYMSVETYRRSGEGVRTPVWFVESGGLLFFLTRADSGKVKRLRHNALLKVAPCKMNGEVTGAWQDGEARFIDSPETMAAIKSLFEQKYGAVLRVSLLMERMQKKKRVFVKVSLTD